MNNNFIFLKFFLLSAGIHVMILSIFSFYESSKKLAETNVIYFDLVNYQDSSSKKNKNINIKVEKNEKKYREDKVLNKIYKKEYILKKVDEKSENSQFENAEIIAELKAANGNQIIDNIETVKLKHSYKSFKYKIYPSR